MNPQKPKKKTIAGFQVQQNFCTFYGNCMIILRYVQLPQLPITPTPCIPYIYFGSLKHFVFNLSFDRLQIKVSFGVRQAFRLGGWITGDRNRSSTQHTFQNTKVHPQVVTFMYEPKNHVSRVAVISKKSARLKSVHSELLSSQFSWSPRFSFARSVWVGVCLDGWSNLPLKWFWNWIENLGSVLISFFYTYVTTKFIW